MFFRISCEANPTAKPIEAEKASNVDAGRLNTPAIMTNTKLYYLFNSKLSGTEYILVKGGLVFHSRFEVSPSPSYPK